MAKLTSPLRLKQFLAIPLIVLLTVATGCRVEKEEAGEAPDVDVQVDPGEMPEYEVEGPEVEVGTEEKEVDVPKVEVTTEEESITVPDVDIEAPSDDEEPESE